MFIVKKENGGQTKLMQIYVLYQCAIYEIHTIHPELFPFACVHSFQFMLEHT